MSWSAWALPGTLTLAVAWGAAIVVFYTAPARPVNRRLALVLVLEGLFAGGSFGVLFLLTKAEIVFALAIFRYG